MRQKIERIKAGHTQVELPAPPNGWQGLPTTGNVKILAVLIAFNDYPFTNPQATIHNQLFGDGNPDDYPSESLTNYYSRASYSQLMLSGATLGWYPTTYPRSSIPKQLPAVKHSSKKC